MTLSALTGALVGLAVAVVARGWMRLIATTPEFTWSGTIAIAATFTVFGLCTGLVGAALARGRSGWWRLAAIPGLGAFLAQGIVVLPLALLSASLFAPRGPLWLRWGLAAAGIVGTITIADDQGTANLPLTIAGMLALGLAGGVGWGRVLRRRRSAGAPATPAVDVRPARA